MNKYISIFLRVSLAIVYLWVVADRMGILGKAGSFGVVWGDFDKFLDYTATLNAWLPREFSDFLGYFVTFVEVLLGLFLIKGTHLKEASLLSSVLLFIFTLSMWIFVGFEESFDFIIFTIVLFFISLVLFIDARFRLKATSHIVQ